jgi:superfamily II DNA or RNA helicase
VGPSALDDLLGVPRQAPFTAVMSAGVEPLPHQRAVIDRAVRTFPRGYLFGDEVGLGKTIEVGLTVRELVLTGKAERVLLLVPAAVLSQWQEELAEKVALWVPRWSESRWVWPDGREIPGKPGDPWASKEQVVLASSHLARRSDQRPKIIAASPWDVVVLDEAHHARRKGGKASGTPNTLLTLLRDLRHHEGWAALYMASATPMQMYPHEAWDLIELFDLPGWWAESAQKFERYFKEVGMDWPTRQWNFLAHMVNDHFSDPSTEPNRHLDNEILTSIKGADRVALISGAGPTARVAVAEKLCRKVGSEVKANKQWYEPVGKKPELASTVNAWLYTNNPMRDRVFRNTRDTLRAYRDAGVWPAYATIPVRVVDDVTVTMLPQEQDLYCEVQDYIRTKYDQAEQIASGQAKNALGFILTVYRRRLTSSFFAIEQSLRRRVAALEGELDFKALLSPDDTVLEEDPDIAAEVAAWALDDEVSSLRTLTDRIAVVANEDESKMLRLHEIVANALTGGHNTVLVFTQYADTMHYVRDRLDAIWHGRVIGYSATGGGTIRDQLTGAWVTLTKRQTKEMFRAGDRVKVLVGTDTLAEGLNLQTCGRLVNYDLPWNFTRVEQRIGRVDRIGGLDRVEVTNLLYDGTVETAVYRKLVDTFGGFNAVVGIAQPILGTIEAVIKEASLTDMCDDHEDPTGTVDANLFDDSFQRLGLDDAVAKVIAAANDAGARTLAELDEHGSPVGGTHWTPAMTLDELRDALLAIPSVAERLKQTDTPGVFDLRVGATPALVTFERAVLDRLAPDVQLLTWGSPLLEELRRWVALDATRARLRREAME